MRVIIEDRMDGLLCLFVRFCIRLVFVNAFMNILTVFFSPFLTPPFLLSSLRHPSPG